MRTTARHPKKHSRAALLAALLAVGLGGLVGCGGSSDSGGTSSSPSSADRAAAAPEAALQDGVEAAAGGGAAGRAGAAADVRRPAVIATGTVNLTAQDVEKARLAAREVVRRLDGEVAKEQTDVDRHGETVTAHLVLRVPSTDFETAMGRLTSVARKRYASEDTKDVTTEVIDTRARLRAQRRSVHRVEVLLDRARNLRDIVLIENELAQRQAALDSLEQQAAYLADRTSMATITVDIDRTSEPTPADHDHTGFLTGLAAGWHGLVTVATGLVTVLGAVLPFAVVLLLLGALGWPVLRRHRASSAPPPTAPAPEA